MRQRSILALALLFASPAFATNGPYADVVKLHFAWPEQLSARSSFSETSIKLRNGKEIKEENGGSYRWQSNATPQGIQIDFSDFQFKSESAAVNQNADKIQALLTRLASTMPSMVIGKDGSYVGPTNMDAFQAMLTNTIEQEFRNALDTAKTTGKPLSTEQQQKMEAVMDKVKDVILRTASKERWESEFRDDWYIKIGAWLDAEMKKGQVYSLNDMSHSPVAKADVPTKVFFQYAGKAACNAQDPGTSCVELRIWRQPEAQHMEQLTQKLVNEMLSATKLRFTIKNYKIVHENRIITEASTLLPYRIETHKRVSFDFSEASKPTEVESMVKDEVNIEQMEYEKPQQQKAI